MYGIFYRRLSSVFTRTTQLHIPSDDMCETYAASFKTIYILAQLSRLLSFQRFLWKFAVFISIFVYVCVLCTVCSGLSFRVTCLEIEIHILHLVFNAIWLFYLWQIRNNDKKLRKPQMVCDDSYELCQIQWWSRKDFFLLCKYKERIAVIVLINTE